MEELVGLIPYFRATEEIEARVVQLLLQWLFFLLLPSTRRWIEVMTSIGFALGLDIVI